MRPDCLLAIYACARYFTRAFSVPEIRQLVCLKPGNESLPGSRGSRENWAKFRDGVSANGAAIEGLGRTRRFERRSVRLVRQDKDFFIDFTLTQCRTAACSVFATCVQGVQKDWDQT